MRNCSVKELENRKAELDVFFDFLLEKHGDDEEFEKVKPLYNRKFKEYTAITERLRIHDVSKK